MSPYVTLFVPHSIENFDLQDSKFPETVTLDYHRKFTISGGWGDGGNLDLHIKSWLWGPAVSTTEEISLISIV